MSLVVSALPPLTLISSLFQFSFLLFPPVCRVLFIWKLLRRSELSELAQRHKQPPPLADVSMRGSTTLTSLSLVSNFFLSNFSNFFPNFSNFLAPLSWRFYEGIHHSHLSLYNLASSFPFIYLLSPKFSSEFLLFSALIWDDGISGPLFE